MFLKMKRDRRIKRLFCADGRKQRKYLSKIEASPPTISREDFFLIVTISAKEHSDVIIINIPGAFMLTEVDGEKMHTRFKGLSAELLAMIDPKLYRQKCIIEKGRPILYAELLHVLYGISQASLKFL